MPDLQTGFTQTPSGNPEHYCRHGRYIGSPYGADILCPWCESGQDPEPVNVSYIEFGSGAQWDTIDLQREEGDALLMAEAIGANIYANFALPPALFPNERGKMVRSAARVGRLSWQIVMDSGEVNYLRVRTVQEQVS